MRCKKPSSEWVNTAEDSDADDSVQTDGSVLAEDLTVTEMAHHGRVGVQTDGSVLAEELAVTEMAHHGRVAEKELSPHPREDSCAYTNFHQAHFGQVAPVLLSCIVQKTIPPSSLHLILSAHQVFGKIIPSRS